MKSFLIAFLLLPLLTSAQTAKEYVEQGDKILNDKKILNDDKRHTDAIALYTKAIATDPTYIDAYRKRAKALQYGLLFRGKGLSPETLIADYTAIINLNPNDAEAYKERAWARRNQQDFNGSIEDFKKLLQLKPNDLSTYNELADLHIRMKDYNSAEKDYTTGILLGGKYYSGRSFVRQLMGNYQGALDDWLEVLKSRKPRDNDFLKLGELYTKLGNYKTAIENYTQAIVLMKPRIEKGTLYESEFKVINPYEERAKVEVLAGDHTGAMVDYNTAIKYNAMPVLYNDRAELKNKIGDKSGACNDWNMGYAIANKVLKEWKTEDSIRYVHRNDRVQVISSSNQDTTIDTLGLSRIILNTKKYCK